MRYSDLKSFTFWTIPYLTICGGIYHLAFWDTFNINGLSYISLGDIIKSFLYPFLSAIIMFGLGIIIGATKKSPDQSQEDTSKKSKLKVIINSRLFNEIFIFFWVVIIYILYKYGSIHRWLLWGFITGLVPYVYLIKTGFLSEYFNNKRVWLSILSIMIFLPTYSFSIGKLNAETIKINKKYNYVIDLKSEVNISRTDTLKLIGFTGKHYFFTNFKNDFTLIIESDKIDYIEFAAKK